MSKITKTMPVCTLNRDFLEQTGANLYTLLFAFQDELVDKAFEQDGKGYRISVVEITDDKIIAFYHELAPTESPKRYPRNPSAERE